MNTWTAGKDLMKHQWQIKKTFYSNLNIKSITDVHYRHANRVFKEFNIKCLGEYHDLYVQSDSLLIADVFENFRKKCIEVYEGDPAYFSIST